MATLGTAPQARVRETSTDSGLGNFVLNGPSDDTDQAFLAAYGGGTTDVPYIIVNLDAAEWEEGLTTVQDDGTGSSEIVRGGSQTVTASSNGGSAVSFSGVNKDVFSPLSSEQTAALIERAKSLTWIVKTSAYIASVRDRILADTSGGTFTVTMPASPLTGDAVWFADGGRSWDANALTVDGNGNNVMGEPDLVANNRDASFALTYNGTQWILGAN